MPNTGNILQNNIGYALDYYRTTLKSGDSRVRLRAWDAVESAVRAWLKDKPVPKAEDEVTEQKAVVMSYYRMSKALDSQDPQLMRVAIIELAELTGNSELYRIAHKIPATKQDFTTTRVHDQPPADKLGVTHKDTRVVDIAGTKQTMRFIRIHGRMPVDNLYLHERTQLGIRASEVYARWERLQANCPKKPRNYALVAYKPGEDKGKILAYSDTKSFPGVTVESLRAAGYSETEVIPCISA